MPFVLAPGHRLVGETRSGYWIEIPSRFEPYRAFVPKPLPPHPALSLTMEDTELASRAGRSLGRLDGVAEIFPDIDIFLSVWLLKEAVYSSQIEGTQSLLSDLLMFEVDQHAEAIDDLRETANYAAAVKAGLDGLKTLPLSLRLLRDAHERLLQSGRGSEQQPGAMRTSQNWIGGTRPGAARYVPPPPEYLADVISDLDKFLNDIPERTPLLIKAALAHAQFETIHPFLDGNGRVGRLLIVLLLCADGALRRPLLYISLFFKRHRDEYYELLQRVRTDGDWESWIRFFLEAVEVTAEEAVASARSAMALFTIDERRIREGMGAASGSALHVLRAMQVSPIANGALLERKTGLSKPTVNTAVQSLIGLNILRELTGKRRNRMFGYDGYLTILQEEKLQA
ncbi:MAG TPA: Fic family protein [Candidatus Dormibacteraeota bacterium]|nr:Fic family protein [Candidatus Dormibacteraeota bacterium]